MNETLNPIISRLAYNQLDIDDLNIG